MTKGEAKQLETDVVIFPMEFGQDKQATVTVETTKTEITVDKSSIKADIQVRFARLKKSLRKRSASIL